MNKAFYSLRASLLVFALFSVGIASAQISDISPYSRYGIGDLQAQSSVLNFSMGGTGIAYHNDGTTPFFVNLKNPASYAYGYVPIEDSSGTLGIKMVAFEAGLTDNIFSLSSEGQTVNSNNAYLAYASIVLPISRHFGMAMGITPVSTEGYNILTSPVLDSDGAHPSTTSTTNTYEGSGGIEKVFLGGAYAPCKYFSIGANVSYLFGNLTNTEEINFNNANELNTLKAENVGIHSLDADFGIMGTIPLWRDWSITIGATLSPSINLTANYNILTVGQNSIGNTIDTLQDSGAVGKIRIPLAYGVGITIKQGDRWTISFDRTGQNWGQYSYFGQPAENLTNSYTWSAGIQYVPKKDYPRTYEQRIHYRAGFSYGMSYLDLYNTPLMDRSFSAGLGLPIGLSRGLDHPAVLNIALQVGSMGTTTNGLILQNYIKLMFGFTFDDHWFDKRKFN